MITWRAALLAVAAVVLGAGPAQAAQTVGSTLANDPDNAPAVQTTSIQSLPATGSPFPVVPSAPGAIVSIRLKHGISGADPGTYGFRIMSGTLPILTARQLPELPDFVWPGNDTPGTRTFIPSAGGVPKGIPIAAGEYLGFTRVNGTTGDGLQMRATAAGAERRFVLNNVHNSGPADYSSAATNSEQLIQYTVEPDADRDGFGDESQDKCLGTPGSYSGCPNTVTINKVKQKGDKKVQVTVTVPGAGTLAVGSPGDAALATASAKSLKAVKKTLTGNSQQKVKLNVKLTNSAVGKLLDAGRLKVKVKALYTPPGGPAGSAKKKKKLKT